MLTSAQQLFALSESLRAPSIFFPKGYDTNRAERILSVLRQTNHCEYLTGLTSYWEPEFSTTLVYSGEPSALKEFLNKLDAINGIRVHITYSDDLSKETGSALQAGSWWVKYSHTKPNSIVIRINRAAKGFEHESFSPQPGAAKP